MVPDRDMDRSQAKGLVLGNGDFEQSGSEPNAMMTKDSAGNVSGSDSSGLCSFQFFVYNEDGLNLSVELNSDPLDWMRDCSNGLRIPHHIHKPKPMALRSEEVAMRGLVGADFFNPDRALQGGFCNRPLSEQVGRSGVDESSGGCIGKEAQTKLQSVPEGREAMGELSAVQPEASQCDAVNEGKELGNRGVEQHAVIGIDSEPRDVEMKYQGVLSGSGQEPEGILPHQFAVPGVDREPRDVVTIDQDVLSGSGRESADQHRVHSHEDVPHFCLTKICGASLSVQTCNDVQNKDGEITGNLGVDGPVENPLEDTNCTHSMIEAFQNKSPRHAIEAKKAPNAKNLRILKILARGPIVIRKSKVKTKRKSARLMRLSIPHQKML